MPLNLTKIAFGAQRHNDIERWFEARKGAGVNTRYRPTRWKECEGGSVFWIHQHNLVARTPIRAFEDTADGRCLIVLEPKLIKVAPLPKRAHQGWRYLKGEPPRDLEAGEDVGDLLPGWLAGRLQKLALI